MQVHYLVALEDKVSTCQVHELNINWFLNDGMDGQESSWQFLSLHIFNQLDYHEIHCLQMTITYAIKVCSQNENSLSCSTQQYLLTSERSLNVDKICCPNLVPQLLRLHGTLHLQSENAFMNNGSSSLSLTNTYHSPWDITMPLFHSYLVSLVLIQP